MSHWQIPFPFNENVENAKETFIAILGHDLRTPLGAIYTSATFMLDTDEREEPHRSLISRIVLGQRTAAPRPPPRSQDCPLP
ncbi:MAG: hypothetical protein H0V06_06835 [Gemmatimonadetes bacterium]|nr:hypothetical protein [Gemmatimonadota bacterium]